LSDSTVACDTQHRELRFRLKAAFFSGLYADCVLPCGPAKAVQRKRCRAEPGLRFLYAACVSALTGQPAVVQMAKAICGYFLLWIATPFTLRAGCAVQLVFARLWQRKRKYLAKGESFAKRSFR